MNTLFNRFLGVNATPTDIANWKAAFAKGSRDEDLITALVTTTTYFLKGHPFPYGIIHRLRSVHRARNDESCPRRAHLAQYRLLVGLEVMCPQEEE